MSCTTYIHNNVFKHIFESLEGICVTDVNKKIVCVNNAFTQITGYSLNEVIGKKPKVVYTETYDKQFYDDMWADIAKNGFWRGEIVDRKKDGTPFLERVYIAEVRTDEGELINYVGMFLDISNEREKEQKLISMSYTDPLTGLFNRRKFEDKLAAQVLDIGRSDDTFAVMFLDLDKFKSINDDYGHKAGDAVLIETSHRLKSILRETDCLARLGGDEFAVILKHLPKDQEVAKKSLAIVAEKIITALQEPMGWYGSPIRTSTSIGIAFAEVGRCERFERIARNSP